jgi:8-amino-7-oxononanoate synthase
VDAHYQSLNKRLLERSRKDALRMLAPPAGGIDFLSNDYLGFARSISLREQIEEAWIKTAYAANGSGGSRLISGNFPGVEELELELAGHFRSEDALLFNAGYTANLGLLSALPERGDVLLYDQLVHASVRDGIRLSAAKSIKFRHNDLPELEQLLSRFRGGKTWVVIESVYSMDGDTAPLEEICALCGEYGAAILLDEAHATGITGKGGGGLAVALGLHEKIFARVITFGKALGSHGAAVLGSKALKSYLVNFCRPFIYTTGISPHHVTAIRTSLSYLTQADEKRERLEKRIRGFREDLFRLGLSARFLNSCSPIQSILIPGNGNAKELEKRLRNAGFSVKAILSPTVAEGKERLRICLHEYNTPEECRSLLEQIKKYVTA